MATYGHTFTSGDTLTPTKLNNARTVTNIVNADISASAAIALSKLATGALPTAITVASANLVDGTIVNADINASAAIAATKLASDSITNTQIKSDAAIALSKLATGALPTAITVASANLVDGTIVNADINASAAIVDTKLATIVTAGKVANTATTATNANSASAIVARDASGNFSAGTITAALTGNVTGNVTGNSSTATTLATGRTIALTGDVTYTSPSFNGSANVTAAATIANNAVTSAKIADGTIVNDNINASAAIALSKLATGALPTAITVASANIVNGTIVAADIASDAVTTAKILDANVTTAKLATVTAEALLPAGAVMAFAMNSAPSGWLAANGNAVSRSTYAALFSEIGVTHGVGNGTTTFNLPDLRGIFVRGSGSQTISGITYNKAFALKEGDAFKTHSHPTYGTESGYRHPVRKGADAIIDGTSATSSVNDAEYEVDSRTDATGDTETRPANIALLYCIKF